MEPKQPREVPPELDDELEDETGDDDDKEDDGPRYDDEGGPPFDPDEAGR